MSPASILRFHLVGLNVVLLVPDHEVCSDTIYVEEPPQVIVGTVEDIELVLLIWDDLHHLCIVHSGCCDMEEC